MDDSISRSPVLHRLPDRPDIPRTPAAPPGGGRLKSSGRKPKNRDLEGGGLASADIGLPSCVHRSSSDKIARRPCLPDLTFFIREIFARTRRKDEGELAVRSSSDDPSDFKAPASASHYSPTSATYPVVLTLSDKGENQAGASGSIAPSLHRPDTSPLLLATKGYYPYDDRGRGRARSPDSTPSTGDEDRPVVRERYRGS